MNTVVKTVVLIRIYIRVEERSHRIAASNSVFGWPDLALGLPCGVDILWTAVANEHEGRHGLTGIVGKEQVDANYKGLDATRDSDGHLTQRRSAAHGVWVFVCHVE